MATSNFWLRSTCHNKEVNKLAKAKYFLRILSNKDPIITDKVNEVSLRWSNACEPLLQEYLTMKTASREYGQFKTLAAQESDWLERLEKAPTEV